MVTYYGVTAETIKSVTADKDYSKLLTLKVCVLSTHRSRSRDITADRALSGLLLTTDCILYSDITSDREKR